MVSCTRYCCVSSVSETIDAKPGCKCKCHNQMIPISNVSANDSINQGPGSLNQHHIVPSVSNQASPILPSAIIPAIYPTISTTSNHPSATLLTRGNSTVINQQLQTVSEILPASANLAALENLTFNIDLSKQSLKIQTTPSPSVTAGSVLQPIGQWNYNYVLYYNTCSLFPMILWFYLCNAQPVCMNFINRISSSFNSS